MAAILGFMAALESRSKARRKNERSLTGETWG
jgi:hypothetical protein